ncbi:MAG: NAD(P)/FAD-dependent oxidoreductase [bacterium]|nr:NAD(P)/FAD-dependent oxidoreductase [bacterium]
MTAVRWDVIVIGAGMAGLKAAYDLQRAGKTVLILEARNRIGGRVHTVRDAAPVPIELGAELIHGEQADTWALVHEYGIATVPHGATGVVLNGQWKPRPDTQDEAVLDKLTRKAERVGEPKPQENMAQYLARLGIQRKDYPASFRLAEYDTELFDGWSARALVTLMSDALGEESSGTDFHVMGGYDTLLMGMAQGLDIRLGQIVTRVSWERDGVRIDTGDGTAYTARKLVLTIPPLVLQQRTIEFVPDLPAEKWQAIDAFARCDIVKVILHFEAPVLPQQFGTLLDETGLPPIWWRTQGHDSFTGEVLVGWAAADHARRLIAMGSEAGVQAALESLRRSTGQADLRPVGAWLQHWNDDPFACGAYPYLPPGMMAERAVDVLAAPVDEVVFWAGAATDVNFTTVHGAYASGQRAAEKVLSVLR